ncbi:putative cation transporter [Klebsiella michiganensis]|uniref:Putative cation transporter n=6 Tax=Enterobacteriaceae TaxID=543 RepID=A0A7H4PH02_9ENTR|nr:putative cation transporter [Klebsiella michiganensis]
MPANMMVLSAGGYKFVDYAKSGIPLIIVSTIVSLILLPILFPFHP